MNNILLLLLDYDTRVHTRRQSSKRGVYLRDAKGPPFNLYLRNQLYVRYTFQIFFNVDHFITKSHYAQL
jgi:hypothetical protein